jgi:lysophospholipase L1-like esterase
MNARGERILIFGDSLSHHGADGAQEIWDVDQGSQRNTSAPGDLLASLLLEQGANAVRVDANVGRSAVNFWMNNARYQLHAAEDLIASDQQFAPSKLVVFLGTNDMGMDLQADQQGFQAIKDSFPNAEAWAIGPPIFADATLNLQAEAVYQTLRNVFGSARTIDARPLSSTVGRARDGIHFGVDAATSFGYQLADKLLSTNPAKFWKTIGLGMIGTLGLVTTGIALHHREQRKPLQGYSGPLGDDGSATLDGDDEPSAEDADPLAPIRKKWASKKKAYLKQLQALSRGDGDFDAAVRARDRLSNMINEAAGYAPKSYLDPVIESLNTEYDALPKIGEAVEAGRQARRAEGEAEIKRLKAEEREVNREFDWMRR